MVGSKIAFFVISQSFTHHFICLNPLSANPTNGQTHSKNSLSICWRIVWVSIAISWYWCFFLTLAFNRTIFYRNNVLSILVLSTKKGYSSFAKKSFVFQKSLCFKFKALKMFKISSDCPIKMCQTAKQRVILKIPSTVF